MSAPGPSLCDLIACVVGIYKLDDRLLCNFDVTLSIATLPILKTSHASQHSQCERSSQEACHTATFLAVYNFS